ncbi:phosphoglycolate phosphatase 2-like isoform X4 [Magnolia sinica]|uniref:phosphoglycolate phosphatase 2-like isoform X4 n=1 Tax=Magnolia sinica TaxID=86752 RepID=UPI00265AB718|nr:phosphoglycolate phosphatase 2-like isoform X4 [Magnolia sinica]
MEASAASSSRPLSAQNVEALFDSVEAFLFDCDGVIWKGDKLIEGVPQTLEMLRSRGKKLVFVTNNSTKSRKSYAKKFQMLGVTVSEEEIFCSSFAAAMYLKSIDFPQEKKVYVIGEEGILEELELAGFTGLGGPEDRDKRVHLKPNFLFEHDKSVMLEQLWLDLTSISTIISSSAGCMVAAVCGSTQKEPVVVGKPSTFLMDFLLKRFQIDTSKMCMVGDRLDTDILFGQNAGCKTLLVLSGVTTLSGLHDPSNNIHPDYYTNQVSDLLELLGS